VQNSGNQLSLQLVASGLCCTKDDVEKLICKTFSALREQVQNLTSYKQWPVRIGEAINELLADGLIIQTSAGQLRATSIGKAIGYSGLLPETGMFLLNYILIKIDRLISLLPTSDTPGDMLHLSFLLFSACLASPEFRPKNGKQPTRFLPYPLGKEYLFNADKYAEDLVEPVWHADIAPINGAKLCCDWIDGAEIRQLESRLQALSAGMLRELFRNLVWVIEGLASILVAASDSRIPPTARPKVLNKVDAKLYLLRKLPRVLHRLSFRINEGLPDDVLWMVRLNSINSEYRLTRSEILSLRRLNFISPENIMLGSQEASDIRLKVFEKTKPTPHAKANWLRDVCRDWKLNQRKRAVEIHAKRAKKCKYAELVKVFYESTGNDFEKVFEQILETLNVSYERLDVKTKTGAPDYLVKLNDSPPLIIELKTKEGDKLVDYNKAVEVLSASEVHGYGQVFCVTLCHPGVDPSVPLVVVSCGRLSVVESCDLGEAFLRICEGSLSQKQLWQWLATPGQALASDLPFKEY